MLRLWGIVVAGSRDTRRALPVMGQGSGSSQALFQSECALAPQDADVVHTEDRVDPVADLEIIHHELRQKDIERMEKVAEGLGKVSA